MVILLSLTVLRGSRSLWVQQCDRVALGAEAAFAYLFVSGLPLD